MPIEEKRQIDLSRFLNVLIKILEFPLYICLGVYYVALFLIINPIGKLNKKKDDYSASLNKSKELKEELEDESVKFEKDVPFIYKIVDKDGIVYKNVFYGTSRKDIYNFLTNSGYSVEYLKTSKWIEFVFGESEYLYKKLSNKDLIFFATELDSYIKSGISLTDSMEILAKQESKNKFKRRVFLSILYYLNQGESFSSALSHQKKSFPNLFIDMIKAAEASGDMNTALSDLEEYYSNMDKIHKDMVSAVSYPAIIFVFSIVVVFLILGLIVPRFVLIYSTAGAELSNWTIFIVNVSNFASKYFSNIVIGILVFSLIFFFAYKKNRGFRKGVQKIALKIPVMGKVIMFNELTIFTKTFAALLNNNVFITDSINILENLTNNEIYKDIMRKTITNIGNGEKISESFKNNFAVPEVVYHMVKAGEESGNMGAMMDKVSRHTKREHSIYVKTVQTLVEPVMIIFLAIIIGGALLSVIMPMFDLYNAIIS